jgi:phenylacetate-CoA ligase
MSKQLVKHITIENYQVLIPEVIKSARSSQTRFKDLSLEVILITLEKLGQLWKENKDYYNKAVVILKEDTNFPEASICGLLDLLPELLSKENLEKRIICELGNLDILDKFSHKEANSGKILARPKGLVLHVSAGNIFLGMIDSLIMALITKNVSLIKLSSNNLRFPQLFLDSVSDVDQEQVLLPAINFLSWKGGTDAIENMLKQQVEVIMAWGGEEMVQNYRQNLPIDKSLLDFGPKI